MISASSIDEITRVKILGSRKTRGEFSGTPRMFCRDNDLIPEDQAVAEGIHDDGLLAIYLVGQQFLRQVVE